MEYDDALNERMVNITRILFDKIEVKKISCALDVGCGAGSVAIELSKLGRKDLQISGIDISHPLLTLAKNKSQGCPNINFIKNDAQYYLFKEKKFDIVVSRFGVMFFDDPIRAFSNIRNSMISGGDLIFVCWSSLQENEFFSCPLNIALKFTDGKFVSQGKSPGPLAFSDKDYLYHILKSSGFINVEIEKISTTIVTRDSPEQDAEFLMNVGFAAQMIREANLNYNNRREMSKNFLIESKSRQLGGEIVYGVSVFLVKAKN